MVTDALCLLLHSIGMMSLKMIINRLSSGLTETNPNRARVIVLGEGRQNNMSISSELGKMIDRIFQLFSFDGLTPDTWFAVRIEYRFLYNKHLARRSNDSTQFYEISKLGEFPTKQVSSGGCEAAIRRRTINPNPHTLSGP